MQWEESWRGMKSQLHCKAHSRALSALSILLCGEACRCLGQTLTHCSSQTDGVGDGGEEASLGKLGLGVAAWSQHSQYLREREEGARSAAKRTKYRLQEVLPSRREEG